MGTIALQSPTVGQLNATEDPKITSDFNILQTLVNGNIDTNNISGSAGITTAQLAANALGLVVSPTTGSATLTDRQLGVYTGTTANTFTLPAPALNARVGVFLTGNIGAGLQLSVATPSGFIAGVGVGVASFGLGTANACVFLQSDGTNWLLTSGYRDTGWLALTGGITAYLNGDAPVTRLIADRVWLQGNLYNNSGGTETAGTALAQLPSGFFPSTQKTIGCFASVASPSGLPAAASLTVSNVGQISCSIDIAGGCTIPLEGLSYRLV